MAGKNHILFVINTKYVFVGRHHPYMFFFGTVMTKVEETDANVS
jgi:hypothetical protein